MVESFMHKTCRNRMCNDCRDIAEEYEQLLQLRTTALQVAEYERSQLEKELRNEKRKSAMYEEVSKAGFADVVCAWMDKEINQLLKVKE